MSLPYQAEDTWYQPSMTIPDMLKHGGGVGLPSVSLADLQQAGQNPDGGVSEIVAQLTSPGGRPEVYFRSLNYALTAGTTPTPITQNRLSVDQIIIDVPSTAANSAFFGFGNGISTISGLEVRPGIPLIWAPDNTREMWELQRQLEYIATLIGATQIVPTLPTYRAPRVVVDPSTYFVVANPAVNLSIALIYVPELQ